MRTEGSIVGEGVEAETSRSMTTFWSLGSQISVSMMSKGLFRIDYSPLSEPSDTLMQITTGLEFRVGHRFDRDLRKSMANQSSEVLWEAAKGIIAAL